MAYRKSHYSGDPRWVTTRFANTCDHRNCGAAIPKDASAFYFPASKSIYCHECGEEESAEFEAARFDEDSMNAVF